MTWITIEVKLPEECKYRYEFPGHPDDCTHKNKKGVCSRENCPYVSKWKGW